MKNYIKSVFALTIICAVTCLLLAITNSVTAPIVEVNEENKVQKTLQIVMPDGSDFELMDVSDKELPDTVRQVYKDATGGYVIKLETAGYSSGMVIMCGVNADGVVTGATCLSSGETLGYEKTYGEKLKDRTLDNISKADTVTSATKTTTAYKNAVADALSAAKILKGGK